MDKRLFLLVAAATVVAIGAPIAAAATRPLSATDHLHVLRQDEQGLDLSLGFGSLEAFEVSTPAGIYTELRLPACTWRQRIGAPKLPMWRRIVQVPLGCSPQVALTSLHSETFAMGELNAGHPILPTQASVSKSQTARPLPFVVDSAAYAESCLEAGPAIRLEELGMLRGARLFAVEVDPVQWDQGQGLLRVYCDIALRVDFPGADWPATRELSARARSPYFQSILDDRLLAGEPERDGVTEYPIKLVIVAHPTLSETLQPFIAWKKRKGFQVITGILGDPEVGTTRNSVKTWLQGLYDSATPESPAPSFFLIAGDTNLLPAWPCAGGHFTDQDYVTLAGEDNLPDVLCGRLSARDAAQLEAIVDKTLEYEQYLMPNPSYLDHSILIGGVDAEFSPLYVNGQINYGANLYFNADHGITANVYRYPESAEPEVDEAVVFNASAGCAFINYSGHGGETLWVDPTFTVSHVNSLTAGHRYATVIGNACQTNRFQITTCLGEAWLRAVNKGAVGYIGASNNSYWDEDYWWSVGAGPFVAEGATYEETGPGVYDAAFHDHGEPFAEWHTTQGAMLLCGGLAVVEAGSTNADYYWEIYNLMGDPSLSTWLRVPDANPATCPDTLFVGQSSLSICAEPYSYAGLSVGGEPLACGLVDAEGSLALHFPPLAAAGVADLVVTHHQKQPVIRALPVIPPPLVAPLVQLARPSNGRARMSWQAVPGATAYRIWRANGLDQPWVLEATTTATSADLPCLPDGRPWIYRVTAVSE